MPKGIQFITTFHGCCASARLEESAVLSELARVADSAGKTFREVSAEESPNLVLNLDETTRSCTLSWYVFSEAKDEIAACRWVIGRLKDYLKPVKCNSEEKSFTTKERRRA